ncbi:MAG: phospholipid carrier-dependent glycosyltransferase [Desulfobacterales bacterium]|nr:phospholipid carrier-dependent glycosyltransferase [Desulfobacterales bacterium]
MTAWIRKYASVLFLWTLLALLLAAILLMAAVPPVDRDALTHHLAVPKLYLQHGAMVEIPAVPFSYYPMNLDLLYLAALAVGNDILPKYIHFAFGLLTCLLIYGHLRRRLEGPAYGLLGCLLFLSLPVIVKLSITVYVDLGLIFFTTASMLQLFRWAESGFRLRHLLTAGVCAGLCLGTKYNGMVSVFLLGLIALILPLRAPGAPDRQRRPGRALAQAALFAAVALAVYSPWMIRNTLWTGNPVYPLAAEILGSEAARVAAGEKGFGGADGSTALPEREGPGLNHFAIRSLVFGESLAEILLVPLRIFFEGADDDPRYFDGRLNPYLLIFPLVALLLARGCGRPGLQVLEQRLMAGFAALCVLVSFLSADMRIRYVAPIIPPLVILAATGIHDLAARLRRKFRRRPPWAAAGVHLAAAALLAMNGAYVAELFGRVASLDYLRGKIDRDAYIQKFRPEYEVVRHANRHLPADARILCLFTGNRIYYSDRAMLCDVELFRDLIRSGRSAEAVAGALYLRGISHLLIEGGIFDRWADAQFDARGHVLLETLFQRHFQGIYHAHGYYLFEIRKG